MLKLSALFLLLSISISAFAEVTCIGKISTADDIVFSRLDPLPGTPVYTGDVSGYSFTVFVREDNSVTVDIAKGNDFNIVSEGALNPRNEYVLVLTNGEDRIFLGCEKN